MTRKAAGAVATPVPEILDVSYTPCSLVSPTWGNRTQPREADTPSDAGVIVVGYWMVSVWLRWRKF